MPKWPESAPVHVVLEVGAGWGYRPATPAHLAQKVCTIEIIPPLTGAAAKTLRALGYDNVSVGLGDGYGGWPECGPLDAIVVTAALGQLPPPLIEQLKVGGRLVMPVGPAYTTQHLTVVEKIAPGKTTTRAVTLVRFVPFTRSQNKKPVTVQFLRSRTWGVAWVAGALRECTFWRTPYGSNAVLKSLRDGSMLGSSMRRVGLIDITVGNATRLGASQRSATRRSASHHIATQRLSRWGSPAARAFSADGLPSSACGSETVMGSEISASG